VLVIVDVGVGVRVAVVTVVDEGCCGVGDVGGVCTRVWY